MQKAGKYESPGLASMDSQSTKTTCLDPECRGFGGEKMNKDSKRPIVSDPMGLLLAVVAHAANAPDSKGVSDFCY